MTFKVPTLDVTPARDLADLSQRFFEFVSHVLEFLRLMPSLELKTFTTVGDFPIYVQTITPRALGVLRVQTTKTADPTGIAVASADTAISWRLSDDTQQPGIVVTSLGGVTGPDELTITLLVLGERD